MFAEVCDFCVLQEQILQLGEIGFSCWELIFVISESPRPIIVNIFLFIKYAQWKYLYGEKNFKQCYSLWTLHCM